MTIISSQAYIDMDIVSSKMEALKKSNATKVIIPCSYVGIIEDEEFAIVIDGHHTMQAAKEIGLEVEFEIKDDSEGLTGEQLLQARYIDCDYYRVESSDVVGGCYDRVW
jgi:uncharacterized protein (DUF1015 family)